MIQVSYQELLHVLYASFEWGLTNHLIIVFSGFSENTAKVKHAYNYVRTLKEFDCHKLFILDNYGPTGCYYIGEDMSFEVETSVLSLITSITRLFNINHENVILAGSSKGGSAALYFGLKYNFGHVVAGAFQTRIADYIKEHRPEAYAYLLGTNENTEGYTTLNSIIFHQLEKRIQTKLFLISSKNDWQYEHHIEPFLTKLKEKNIPHTYFECHDMIDHSDIGNHFPDFLINKLLLILYSIQVHKLEFSLVDNQFIGRLDISDELLNVDVSLIVKETNTLLISTSDELNFVPNSPGFYTLLYQIKRDHTVVYEKQLLHEFIGAGQYELHRVDFLIKDDHLHLTIHTDCNDLTYAYYIIKNGSIISKTMYQPDHTLVFPVEREASYQVQFYIKDKSGKVAVSKTKALRAV